MRLHYLSSINLWDSMTIEPWEPTLCKTTPFVWRGPNHTVGCRLPSTVCHACEGPEGDPRGWRPPGPREGGSWPCWPARPPRPRQVQGRNMWQPSAQEEPRATGTRRVLGGGGPLLERLVVDATVVRADVDPARGAWPAGCLASRASCPRGTPGRHGFAAPRLHHI